MSTSSLAKLLVLLPLVFVAGCDGSEDVEVRVMSQNLYLGGDLFTVTAEMNPQLVPVRVAQLYGTIQASNPEARMAAIAAEIADVNPDLVGLQEVSTFYVQSPADNLPGSPATPATEVTFDFLELLLDALEDEGVSYRVVAQSDNSDVELPATTDGGTTFFDVRYQDADVILARSDVQTSSPTDTEFQALVTVNVGGFDQQFVRSYQSVRATVEDAAFTFFNTHLEVGGAAALVQQAQGAELAAAVAATSGPVILVGDLNSDAGGTDTSTYATLTGVLADAAGRGLREPTCCQDPDLRNDDSVLTTRIDLILYDGFEPERFETVLDSDADKTSGDFWPSDHAGVWAEFEAEVGAEVES